MTKKKPRKHLQFYMHCMNNNELMPYSGLCMCAHSNLIKESLLDIMKPDNSLRTKFSYWARGHESIDLLHQFSTLRQTIVLFMAAINNEL